MKPEQLTKLSIQDEKYKVNNFLSWWLIYYKSNKFNKFYKNNKSQIV